MRLGSRTPQPYARWGLAALAVAVGLAAAWATLSTATAAPNAAQINWVEYAAGLVEPTDLAFTGVVTDTRLFVAQRDGQVKIVLANGSVLTDAFLDLRPQVDAETHQEIGLFALTFDPDYAATGAVYVYYNDLNGDLQLSRFQVSADPNVALTTEVKLLTIPHPTVFHNGGDLNFGPDGYLYLSPGDGGFTQSANSQDLTSLLGKLLRLNVTGVPTYTIPASNPFTQTVGARSEIWAYGLRNAWRFSFDTATGDLYLADVGDVTWEELNVRPATSAGGENYGWPCYEGRHAHTTPLTCPAQAATVWPAAEYPYTVGDSITGGHVYRGSDYPYLAGYYFFADFITQRFFALNTTSQTLLALGPMLPDGALPVTFGQDAQGELYVADFGSGAIYKLAGLEPFTYTTWLPLVAR